MLKSLLRAVRGSKPTESTLSKFRQGLAGWDEFKRDAVIAPALPGRFRSVVEDVALVALAAGAMVFGAWDDHPEIASGAYMVGIDRLPETRPAGARVVLVGAGEQRQKAAGTKVGTVSGFLVQRTGKGALSTLATQHPILFGAENLAPLRIAQLQCFEGAFAFGAGRAATTRQPQSGQCQAQTGQQAATRANENLIVHRLIRANLATQVREDYLDFVVFW
jgi:hypothetical protein